MFRSIQLKRSLLLIQGVLSYSLYVFLLPLLPVILRQGKSVKANTIRLPEANGLRYHIAQHRDASMPTHALLHIGESTVAGVGVDEFHQGLTANIMRNLNHEMDYSWQAIGQNGAVIRDINDHLKAAKLRCVPDSILLTMGVNDTTSLTSRNAWQVGISQCIEMISAQADHPVKVCFTQVPPMHLFPALPFPLNKFLGLRAWQLDNALQQLCLTRGWTHLKIDMPLESQWMAEDGYHPNEIGYKKWAEEIAPRIKL